jgi:mannose-6-phosphate isomerase-like protein (cupin superfamily)
MKRKLLDLYKENRPWGKFERFIENEKCTVKILYLNPHSKTSLQIHKNRDEFWKVLDGCARVELEDRIFSASKGDVIQISKNLKHRVITENKSCVIMEISLGEFNENDIIRIEDDYNRL